MMLTSGVCLEFLLWFNKSQLIIAERQQVSMFSLLCISLYQREDYKKLTYYRISDYFMQFIEN